MLLPLSFFYYTLLRIRPWLWLLSPPGVYFSSCFSFFLSSASLIFFSTGWKEMAVFRLTLWKRTERLPNKQCYLSIENKNKTFYKQISASACLGLVLRHPVDLFFHAATLTFFGSLIKVCKKLALGLGSPFRPPDRSFRNFWSFGEFYEVQKRHATRILKLQSCEWVGRAISAGGDRVCCCCSLRSKLVYSVDRVCYRCFLRS